MPAKRYKVTLTDEERQDLLALISKGKAAAHNLTRARILLQACQGSATRSSAVTGFTRIPHFGLKGQGFCTRCLRFVPPLLTTT